jgi:acyl-coenzyme A synthetase/AMP-(fatty) acid ligase
MRTLSSADPGAGVLIGGPLRSAELPYLRGVRLLGQTSRKWAQPIEIRYDDPGATVDGIDDVMLEALEAEVAPGDLLTVVYTSGSSATPKAVMHTHGAVLRNTSPVIGQGSYTTFPGRVLGLTPFFWVGGFQNVAGALQSGAAILTLEHLHLENA